MARLRVFVVGADAADLETLREALTRAAAIEIVGTARLADVNSRRVEIPDHVDAVVMPPGAAQGTPRVNRESTDVETVEHLTPRERNVLALVADGLGNRDIAAALGISEHTVKFHLASVFGKLGVSSRTEAVRRGLQQGLIEI